MRDSAIHHHPCHQPIPCRQLLIPCLPPSGSNTITSLSPTSTVEQAMPSPTCPKHSLFKAKGDARKIAVRKKKCSTKREKAVEKVSSESYYFRKRYVVKIYKEKGTQCYGSECISSSKVSQGDEKYSSKIYKDDEKASAKVYKKDDKTSTKVYKVDEKTSPKVSKINKKALKMFEKKKMSKIKKMQRMLRALEELETIKIGTARSLPQEKEIQTETVNETEISTQTEKIKQIENTISSQLPSQTSLSDIMSTDDNDLREVIDQTGEKSVHGVFSVILNETKVSRVQGKFTNYLVHSSQSLYSEIPRSEQRPASYPLDGSTKKGIFSSPPYSNLEMYGLSRRFYTNEVKYDHPFSESQVIEKCKHKLPFYETQLNYSGNRNFIPPFSPLQQTGAQVTSIEAPISDVIPSDVTRPQAATTIQKQTKPHMLSTLQSNANNKLFDWKITNGVSNITNLPFKNYSTKPYLSEMARRLQESNQKTLSWLSTCFPPVPGMKAYPGDYTSGGEENDVALRQHGAEATGKTIKNTSIKHNRSRQSLQISDEKRTKRARNKVKRKLKELEKMSLNSKSLKSYSNKKIRPQNIPSLMGESSSKKTGEISTSTNISFVGWSQDDELDGKLAKLCPSSKSLEYDEVIETFLKS